MSTAIKPRKSLDTKSHGKYARRYMFYPLEEVSFLKTQSISPVYCPVFPKSEIVLLEAFPYLVPSVGASDTGETVGLEEQIMGTDAQVKFIMGNSDSGKMASGMILLDQLTDYEPEVVVEIQEFIFPNGYKPETLVELGNYLAKRLGEVEGEYSAEIKSTIGAMISSVNLAKTYCNATINQIEAEINDSKTGKKLAMKSGLDPKDIYLYNQVGRSLPEDKSGVNMAQELGKILAGALGAPQLDPEKQMESEMAKFEVEALKRELEEKERLIQELAGYEAEPSE